MSYTIRIACLAFALSLVAIPPDAAGQELVDEPVLFFTGRADQTGSANGGAVRYVLGDDSWQWWFQDVRYATLSPNRKRGHKEGSGQSF